VVALDNFAPYASLISRQILTRKHVANRRLRNSRLYRRTCVNIQGHQYLAVRQGKNYFDIHLLTGAEYIFCAPGKRIDQ